MSVELRFGGRWREKEGEKEVEEAVRCVTVIIESTAGLQKAIYSYRCRNIRIYIRVFAHLTDLFNFPKPFVVHIY